jgi:glycerol-3-phosphate cytidylyltransferase
MKKILTYGSFDLLHWGHVNILKRAKELGDYLLVGLSTDEFNAIKNKKSYFSYEKRKLMLEAIRYVDEVIPEHVWEQKITDVIEHNVDVFVMGDDWEGRFDFLREYCDVIYLPRTVGISSSKIKSDLRD